LRNRLAALAATMGVVLVSGACIPGPGATTTTTTPQAVGMKRVGYFSEGRIYDGYQPKNLVTSGTAAKLTHLSVSFGNIVNGQCAQGDAYAETGMVYDAASSVDGIADSTAPGTLHGIFGQLRKLKAMYPALKVFWTFGGGSAWSGGFTQAATNPVAFANSCYSLVHDARWAGLFDGIDIDWEFPNSCVATCDASGPNAFRNLMAAVRNRFGNELVLAAVPGGPSYIAAGGYENVSQYVDWFTVMAFDFVGSWTPFGPTAPHSALSDYAGTPIPGLNAQSTVSTYRNMGIPAEKLVLGVTFYGVGWTGVTQTAPGGSATGLADGSHGSGLEAYRVLAVTCPPTGTVGGTAYAKCGPNWWTYDTPTTLAAKARWAKSQGLGGTAFWELSMDTADGQLVSALHANR
jgi:chitinase